MIASAAVCQKWQAAVFCYKTLILAAQRSGSFPEQSNKMNERSATWRQTNKTVYIHNRKQAGKPHHDWSYEKSPVTKVTGTDNFDYITKKPSSPPPVRGML